MIFKNAQKRQTVFMVSAMQLNKKDKEKLSLSYGKYQDIGTVLFNSMSLDECLEFTKKADLNFSWIETKKEDFLFKIIGFPSDMVLYTAQKKGLLHVEFRNMDGIEVKLKDGIIDLD